MQTSDFNANQVITINSKKFTISSVEPNDVQFGDKTEDLGKLVGTLEGDPSFLAGKRTIFPRYLQKNRSNQNYRYDFNAR